MKSTNVILAKTLSCVLITGILTTTSLPTKTTYAANINNNNIQKNQSYETGVIYEDEDFKITQTENERVVLDKKTLKNVTLTFTDSTHSNGIYKDAEGNIKKYSKDKNGNVYLDDECVLKVTKSIEPEEKNKNFRSYASPRSYTNSNYFIGKNGYKYYYVTTYTYNTKQQVMQQVLLLNYAYRNYFYSDSNHSKLIESNTVYKKMW